MQREPSTPLREKAFRPFHHLPWITPEPYTKIARSVTRLHIDWHFEADQKARTCMKLARGHGISDSPGDRAVSRLPCKEAFGRGPGPGCYPFLHRSLLILLYSIAALGIVYFDRSVFARAGIGRDEILAPLRVVLAIRLASSIAVLNSLAADSAESDVSNSQSKRAKAAKA